MIYSETIANSLLLVAPIAATASKNPNTCSDLCHGKNTLVWSWVCVQIWYCREMTKQTNPQKHPRSRLVHIPATATAFGWTKTPRRSDNGTSISAFVVQQKTENLTQKKHKSLGINIPGMGHETNTKTNVVYLSIHPSIYIPLYYMRSDIYIYIYTPYYISTMLYINYICICIIMYIDIYTYVYRCMWFVQWRSLVRSIFERCGWGILPECLSLGWGRRHRGNVLLLGNNFLLGGA